MVLSYVFIFIFSYVIEASGTACGLDWRDNDTSFFKMLLWVNSLFAIIAVFAMWAAFSHDVPTAESGKKEEEWFTDKSLNWVNWVKFIIIERIFLCTYNMCSPKLLRRLSLLHRNVFEENMTKYRSV